MAVRAKTAVVDTVSLAATAFATGAKVVVLGTLPVIAEFTVTGAGVGIVAGDAGTARRADLRAAVTLPSTGSTLAVIAGRPSRRIKAVAPNDAACARAADAALPGGAGGSVRALVTGAIVTV